MLESLVGGFSCQSIHHYLFFSCHQKSRLMKNQKSHLLDKIQVELEQLLGCRVDLVRVRDNMNSLLRKRILSEGIYV